jgi:hypothetical protein
MSQTVVVATRRIAPRLAIDEQIALMAAILLALWSTLTAVMNHVTYDAVTSSVRILAEVGLFLLFSRRYNLRGGLERLVVVLSLANSIVVLAQILEQMDLLATHFSDIPVDIYGIEVEYFRKPGLLNGFQTSSLLSFLAIVIATARLADPKLRTPTWYALIVINILPIFFGARVFLVLLPFVFVANRRLLGLTAILFFAFISYADLIGGELGEYVDNRITPAFQVVFGGNVESDYSAADTISHYRMPEDVHELIFGNGEPRYPVGAGGGDPTFSRWLLQAGAPAAALVTFLSALVILRVARCRGIAYKILAASLALATFKGELVSATGVVFALLTLSQTQFPLQPQSQPDDAFPSDACPHDA